MNDLKGKTALVTGASSGIGASFARLLASRGADLVLVARRAERMTALGEELRAAHGVKVTSLSIDLSARGAGLDVFERTEGAGVTVDLLINNAGFGTHSAFVDIPWEKTLEQMQLNLVTLTELTWRFARRMRERGRGHILNVASVGAFQPTPLYATYGAGKAYVRNFSEALAYELSGSGVEVCCLCPGATETEFSEVAGQPLDRLRKLAFMSADRCARIGLRALLSGRRLVVSGWMNAFAMFLVRLLPRRLATFLAAKALG